MKRELVIRGGLINETAVLEDGKLVEYVQEISSQAVDTIFLGKVTRVVPGLHAAFVDIGDEKNGFLPLTEKSIDAPLSAGDRVLVQVRREATEEKGAFLSRDISLVGAHVLLLPLSHFIGVSSRITFEPRREELSALGRQLAGDRFGLVMRTSAEQTDDQVIRQEVNKLSKMWTELSARAATAFAPSLLYCRSGAYDGLIADYLPETIDSITTDNQGVYENYHRTHDVYLVDKDPVAGSAIEKERDKALERKVWLKSGANLIIDECEALTVIDVNTAKYTGSRMDRQVLIRTNLEACHEIVRQIRLRNLGGIILIDMIDMDTDEEREIVLNALKSELKKDRIKTVVHGFTNLGLIEMTRRRTRIPLRKMYGHVCPVCRGAGVVPRLEAEKWRALQDAPGDGDGMTAQEERSPS